MVSKFFTSHIETLEVGANGLAFAQDFYNTHVMYWQESKGYLPAELKKYFTQIQKNACSNKREVEVTPVQEGCFVASKKMKTNSGTTKQQVEKAPLHGTRHSIRLQDKELRTYEDIDDEDEEEVVSEEGTISDREPMGMDSVEFESNEKVSTGELYSWAVPTGEELEKCASVWVSGGSLVAEQEVEESPEQVQAKKNWVQVHFPAFNMHTDSSHIFPTNCSFIVMDCRVQTSTSSVSNDEILEQLTFISNHLSSSGVLILVPPMEDLSRITCLLEESATTIHFKRDGPSYVHYYLYDVSADSRLKSQNLIVPYIVAFKSSVPGHACFTTEEGVVPANSICLSNTYPAYTNIISGFNASERFYKIQENTLSLVL